MATFYNQATLSFGGRLTNSNVTTGEILVGTNMTKTAISASYGADDAIGYVVSIVNNAQTAQAVTLTDDLGAYAVGTNTVYPLEYVDGTVKYYVNGNLQEAPNLEAGPPLVISGLTIPAGGNITVIYEAKTNEFANIELGSSITNTATVTFDTGTSAPLIATATVPAGEETILTIAKSISPATVGDNGEITYTFVIQNTGNTPAVATDNVIITDTFTPILNPVTVTFNDEVWDAGTNYTYSETTGEFATLEGMVTVPAATYTQDPETGVITVTPGVSVLTVTGNV